MTREHARKERQDVENENTRLKEQARDMAKAHEAELADAKIREDDIQKRCRELEEEGMRRFTMCSSGANGHVVSITKTQLQAEVERAKQLTGKPPSSTKSVLNGVIGDSNTNAVKLYEDLTNLMITNCKTDIDPDTGYPQLIYQCMCTGSPTGSSESKG
jgi:hypothetical protein